MYKKVLRVVTEVQEVISGVQCNKCGRTVDFPEGNLNGCDEALDFHEVAVRGGPEGFPGNLVAHLWVMCPSCLQELLASFVVPLDSFAEPLGRTRVQPILAIDTRDEQPVEVHQGLVYPQGQSPCDAEEYPIEVVAEIDTYKWPPPGIFRHYKGSLYLTVGACLRAGTREPLVLYRELYGKSRHWVRPLSEWSESVNGPGEKEQIRFTEISSKTGTP